MTEQPIGQPGPARKRRSFLIWLSGADPDILRQAPTDRPKYQGMGGAVLTTATLASFSMFFAMRMAVSAPVWGALIIAAVWFGAILNLDRWLVTSLQRSSRKRDILKIAVPRLVLALLFGVIISTPLVLQIFRPEVEAEMGKIRLEQTDSFTRNLTSGAAGDKIKTLEEREGKLLATISSGGTVVDTESDPTVVTLQGRLDGENKKRDKALSLIACEQTGQKKTADCPADTTGKPGQGAFWEKAKENLRNAQRDITALNKQLASRRQEIESSASASRTATLQKANEALPGIQKELKGLRDLQDNERTSFETKNASNTGLLIRLKALDRVSQGDWTLLWWRILLFLLITTLECLPIFVKTLSLFGRPSAYERLLLAYEDQQVSLGEQTARRKRATGFVQNNEELTYASLVAEERERNLRAMARRTAETEREIAERALATWRERELRDLPNNVDRYVSYSPNEQQPPSGPPPAPSSFGPFVTGEPRNGHRRESWWGKVRASFDGNP